MRLPVFAILLAALTVCLSTRLVTADGTDDLRASTDPVPEFVLLDWFSPPTPSLDEQLWLDDPFQLGGGIYLDHGVFRSAFQQPLAPLQPIQPAQPPSMAP